MTPNEMLHHPTEEFLLAEERGLTSVVIAAPHHAPEGVTSLPCEEHPVSDENAGFLARYLAERLDASSVVAINARKDPNKIEDSEYSKAIDRWSPRILIEIHGHGGKKAKSDIEISGGSEQRQDWAVDLAKHLDRRTSASESLKHLSASGAWREIYFRATRAVTLARQDRVGLHIELPPELRKEGRRGAEPPQEGFRFCDLLASSVVELFIERATADLENGKDASGGTGA